MSEIHIAIEITYSLLLTSASELANKTSPALLDCRMVRGLFII